jgi:hypothetical protein
MRSGERGISFAIRGSAPTRICTRSYMHLNLGVVTGRSPIGRSSCGTSKRRSRLDSESPCFAGLIEQAERVTSGLAQFEAGRIAGEARSHVPIEQFDIGERSDAVVTAILGEAGVGALSELYEVRFIEEQLSLLLAEPLARSRFQAQGAVRQFRRLDTGGTSSSSARDAIRDAVGRTIRRAAGARCAASPASRIIQDDNATTAENKRHERDWQDMLHRSYLIARCSKHSQIQLVNSRGNSAQA